MEEFRAQVIPARGSEARAKRAGGYNRPAHKRINGDSALCFEESQGCGCESARGEPKGCYGQILAGLRCVHAAFHIRSVRANAATEMCRLRANPGSIRAGRSLAALRNRRVGVVDGIGVSYSIDS